MVLLKSWAIAATKAKLTLPMALDLSLSTVDGNTTQVELDTVHRIDIENPLVSMGKLVRVGYQVHLNSPTDAVLYTPQGEEIPIQHGEDDVLYLQPHPHAEKVCQVKSSGKRQTFTQLHKALGHVSLQKVKNTLQHSKGVMLKDSTPHDEFCPACAMGNSTRRHLSHKGTKEHKPGIH